MAAGLRIQIPPGINLKDKPHKGNEKRNSNQHQQLNTVKKPAALLSAVISSLPCHSLWINCPTQNSEMSLQQVSFPSPGVVPSPGRRPPEPLQEERT